MTENMPDVENIPTDITLTATLRPLLIRPNPLLKRTACVVEENEFKTDKFNQLLIDMFFTVRSYSGIGLAAPQIGVNKRAIVLNLAQPLILINPVIVSSEGEVIFEEGCLSVPDFFADVKRSEKIRTVYQNASGTRKELSASGVTAICIQHEIDHLNGTLFTDHVSKLKQIKATKRVSKFIKQHPEYTLPVL